jgi:hypothetical protein
MSETTHRALRLALASLITVALVSQLFIGMSRGGLTVVRFFSYFTVLSNTAAVVMLAMLAARPGRDSSEGFAIFRGAVTVYMSVTGLVYAVILAPNLADVAVPEPWIDWTIHVLGPILVIADWFHSPPRHRLHRNIFWIWLVFPAIYLVYSLIRGPLVGWYPYPFLDPDVSNGYLGVASWSLVVLGVIVGFSALYHWWAGRSPADPEPG